MLICIDPGHGGADPGAIGPSGLREKDVVLDIALRLLDRLKEHGFAVILTRENDRYVGLSERADLANANHAAYLLSIHNNAGGGTGYESYVQPGYDGGETGRIRGAIHQHIAAFFAAQGMPDRGKKQMDLAVCRETRMPASLHEVGFVDGSPDAQKLADPTFRQGVAEAFVAGLCEAFGVQYYPPQPAAPAQPQPAPQPAQDWKATAMGWLKNSGLVNSDHAADSPVTWAEFAAVLSRLKGGQ